MHELKTPITKGRIAVEMIEHGKNQERLISVFERLESLINEFAAVERATAGTALGECGIFSMDEILKEALSIAMIEPGCVTLQNPLGLSLNVDLKLFCVAVKNLIDNAVKYAADGKILIRLDAETMDFITLGEPLQKDFSYYKEAFVKGTNAKQSFGLGLYIVDNIAKAHGLKFLYRRQDELNVFYFEGIENIATL